MNAKAFRAYRELRKTSFPLSLATYSINKTPLFLFISLVKKIPFVGNYHFFKVYLLIFKVLPFKVYCPRSLLSSAAKVAVKVSASALVT